MNVTESTPNVIDVIAEEFVQRYRRGERPAVAEYEARYPEEAEAIRELFPALVVMERLKPESKPAPTSSQAECASEVASLGRLGDYRIVREIGRGGMGIVYEAVQESLGRKVALKVLPKQLVGDESRQARFDREARAAARLHHTNIVPVFGVGQESGLHYYAMQYIHGLGLDEVLRELKRLKSPSHEPSSANNGSPAPAAEEPRQEVTLTLTQALITGQFAAGAADSESPPPADLPSQPGSGTSDTAKQRLSQTQRLSDSLTLPGAALSGMSGTGRGSLWQSVARIGVQVSEALHYAHEQGVLHRDVKPSNLLLDTRGTVWVTDFGLAKSEDHQDLTQTGDVLGTLRYMAPEMFSGKADRRSDVYSLGLTLYELLAQRSAFDEPDRGRLIRLVFNESPPRLRNLEPLIPRDLETIVHKAIDREPSHRYASAQDLADDLTRFLHDEPIHARRVSLATRFSRWCKRNPAVASLTSAIAILLLVATGVSLAAAMVFQQMAHKNAVLAGDLKKALGDAEKNLAEVQKQEQLAQTNLNLATAEQERAEGNLDLALKALDAVYLDAIGEKKLRGAHIGSADGEGDAGDAQPIDLSDFERELLKRGLTFYEEFARRNRATSRAAAQSARAYYRVAMLQGALDERGEAEKAFRESIQRFVALTRNEPKNHEFWHELGRAYFGFATIQRKRRDAERAYAKSEDAMTTAINLQPNTGAYYISRSKVYVGLIDYRHAQDDAARAAELDNDSSEYHLAAALRYLSCPHQFREINKALHHCERALELEPGSAEAHNRLAYVLLYVDVSRALEHVNTAIEVDPTRSEAFSLRARLYMNRGDYDLALSDFGKAIQLNPNALGAYKWRAHTYITLRRFDEARADIETAAKLHRPGSPAYADMLQMRARLHVALQDYRGAVADYTLAIEKSPLSHWHYWERSIPHFHLGKYDKALEDIKTSLELQPTDLTPLFAIPSNLVAECPDPKFKDGLLQLATKALENRPETGDSHYIHDYNYALLCLSMNDQARYRQACAMMVRQEAKFDSPQAANFTAWTCVLLPNAVDDYSAAIALAVKAAVVQPENNEFLKTVGAVLYRAGKHQEALERLTEVSGRLNELDGKANSSPAYTWYFLAMAQHQLGKKDEARMSLHKAAELTKAELSDEKDPPVWNRKLTLELLQKEAESLIGPAATPANPAPPAPPLPESKP